MLYIFIVAALAFFIYKLVVYQKRAKMRSSLRKEGELWYWTDTRGVEMFSRTHPDAEGGEWNKKTGDRRDWSIGFGGNDGDGWGGGFGGGDGGGGD
ncbi:hypothetical protein [Pontivivens insulae]|uniref:Uncharacterized protein n=1 Tax=Pontivivens insulae TaxID=1639689 RepID=A0A2R8AEX9_9RHOB|nr:hypothetical protein [Pontivivens insulae]RED12055.1 hypothetical protein DFR53_2768 [Pontivivens insulae]SPF30811.1 hypothetical protein POI8812_03155 [Pontivivens insulae]